MPFTPIESSVGGLLIGLSSSAHLYLNGEISGMSGISGKFVRGLTVQREMLGTPEWIRSFLYMCGIIFGGASLYTFIAPQQFMQIPGGATITQYLVFALIGFLVGFGTQMANGCTSGHMICGLARLSKRSLAAVMTFCAVAFVLVKGFGSIDRLNALLNQPPTAAANTPFYTLPSASFTLGLLLVLFAVAAVYAFVIFAVRGRGGSQLKGTFYMPLYFFNGFVFALGLGLSGMTLPTKVLGFFDVFGPHFDPSLVCVAVGAILFDLILFQGYILHQPAPLVGSSFCLPTSTSIDAKLIVGSAIFGLGWGTLGICPGPAFVNIAPLAPQFLMFNAAFAVGIMVKHLTG